MKSIADIILETIEYYGTDPVGKRGLKTKEVTHIDPEGKRVTKTKSQCEYVVTNGETKYCAIGRCLTDDAKAWAVNITGGVNELIKEWWSNSWAASEWANQCSGGYYADNDCQDPEEDNEVYLNDMLQEDYRGHEVAFWDKLQELHDENDNWNGGGPLWLTETGYNKVKELAFEFMDRDECTSFMIGIEVHTEVLNDSPDSFDNEF